jgi:hypothetical protein
MPLLLFRLEADGDMAGFGDVIGCCSLKIHHGRYIYKRKNTKETTGEKEN